MTKSDSVLDNRSMSIDDDDSDDEGGSMRLKTIYLTLFPFCALRTLNTFSDSALVGSAIVVAGRPV